MVELIKKMFTEDNGNASSMRFLVAFVIVVVLFNWTWINIKTGQIVTLDWQELGLIIGPLFAKAYQKGKEKE